MKNHVHHNQAYLHWYLGMQEPQAAWSGQEIRPEDIVPMPKTTVFTNPWAFNGTGNEYGCHCGKRKHRRSAQRTASIPSTG